MEGLQNHEEDLLIDREILESYIRMIVNADPDAPDLLAHLFVKFKSGLENKLYPPSQICETLKVAIELTYLHTKAHAAALKLYTLYQQGELLIQDYPLSLINAAIERSTVRDELKGEISKPLNEESNSEE
jgi:hypothetical protein